jgi:hypothetical protein
MVSSVSRVVAALGLLLPTVTSFAVSHQNLEHRTPEVPWKKTGLFSGRSKRQGYETSCNHGPQSRGCWIGDFNIDTDMDVSWPDTGKTVKYDLTITNTTGAPDGFERPMFLINGQYPGPVSTVLNTPMVLPFLMDCRLYSLTGEIISR